MDFKKLKKHIVISIIVGIGIIAGLSIYSDVDALIDTFVHFNYAYLPLILILAPLNYFFRFIKWSYYLHIIDAKVDRKDNLLIFLSGLCMTITPGKIGEFFKSFLLKEHSNISMSSTLPLVMGERMTDGMSMLILAGMGSLAYNYGKGLLTLVLLIMIVFVAVVQSPPIVHRILDWFKKVPVIRRFSKSLENFYDKSYIIFKWRPLLFAVTIGVVSWFFEGVVIYLTIKAMGTQITLLESVFIVSFSTIVGAISMMPGGLFAAEGSIVGLLVAMDYPRDIAVGTTIITRFSTLWLGVAIGLIALIVVQKKMFNEE